MPGPAYNIFAMGQPRAGKRHSALAVLEPLAARRPVAADLCYVNRFDRPREPRILELPASAASSCAPPSSAWSRSCAPPSRPCSRATKLRARRGHRAEVKERNERDLDAIHLDPSRTSAPSSGARTASLGPVSSEL
ncbi:MAG: Lon-like protease helical domain-containing protein [Myxococcota bacterium]